jgi:lysozyme
MKTSVAGRAAITSYEGCKLQAYQDGAGVWTCGVGHTRGVTQQTTCTQELAQAWLETDLCSAEMDVSHLVHVHLTQEQFDALVSFVFNLGGAALAMSTLLKKLNIADYDGAADQFKAWNLVAGKPSLGLIRRRAAEAAMFASPWRKA